MRHWFCRFFIHNWTRWVDAGVSAGGVFRYQERTCVWCNRTDRKSRS